MTTAERIYGNVKMEVGRMLRLPTNQPMAERIAEYVVNNFSLNIGQKNMTLPHVNHLAIRRAVVKKFGMPFTKLVSPSRKREIVHPRDVLMYLLYTRTPLGVVAIGRMFKLDHSTVLHAKKKIGDQMAIDIDIKRDIEELNEILTLSLKPPKNEQVMERYMPAPDSPGPGGNEGFGREGHT